MKEQNWEPHFRTDLVHPGLIWFAELDPDPGIRIKKFKNSKKSVKQFRLGGGGWGCKCPIAPPLATLLGHPKMTLIFDVNFWTICEPFLNRQGFNTVRRLTICCQKILKLCRPGGCDVIYRWSLCMFGIPKGVWKVTMWHLSVTKCDIIGMGWGSKNCNQLVLLDVTSEGLLPEGGNPAQQIFRSTDRSNSTDFDVSSWNIWFDYYSFTISVLSHLFIIHHEFCLIICLSVDFFRFW